MSKLKTTLAIFAFLWVGNFNSNAQTDSLWTLQRCIEYALEHNLTVQNQQLNVNLNEVNFQQSKLNLAPSVNASTNYGLNWGLSINPVTNFAQKQQQSNGNASLSTSWIIFSGGRNLRTIRQNKTLLENGENDLEKTKNDVILSLITFYTNVIFNEELLNNAQKQYSSTNSQLDRTQKQVAAGSLPRSAELDLVAQLANNELNVINADNNLQISLLQLKQSMLLKGNASLGVVIPEIELDSSMLANINAQRIYKEAELTMPEIRSADGQIAAAEIGIDVAKGSYYPSLRLNAGVNTNYSSIIADRGRFEGDGTMIDIPTGSFVGSSAAGSPIVRQTQNGQIVDYATGRQLSDNFGQFVSLNLSIPIFNNYQANAGVQRAKITREQAIVQAQQARQVLRQTIETASTDALSAAKSYVSSFKRVEAQEESFRATQQRFQNGAANYTEYQVAENNLFQSKSDLLRAKYSFIFRLIILDFYQGNPIEL
ncbi:MAG: TolC family protein [Cyclobacteriaceae bacterium]|nr:TolC family protein [Cyclobacteriaceae bacterium]